ncbi:MAG: hypothetical protein Q8O11_08790, partial [Syntrophales bacterium]|nr:hypothetical protein [Syntrophales bacterium]
FAAAFFLFSRFLGRLLEADHWFSGTYSLHPHGKMVITAHAPASSPPYGEEEEPCGKSLQEWIHGTG